MAGRLDTIEDILLTLLQQLADLAEVLHVLTKLDTILDLQGAVMADLGSIRTAVESEAGVSQSAITLLNELAGLIRANATDQAALNNLADQLEAQSGDLAAAVEANTPAAPGDGGEPTP